MYLKKTWKYGNRIEVRKYHTSRYGVKGERRAPKEKTTELSVEKANARAAEKRLNRLLVGNFDECDNFITLTYRKEDRPDVEGSRKILKKFLNGMRKEYKKAGEELKYIFVTEWNGKSIHHHIVMNDIPGFSKILSRNWTYGGKNITPLYANHDYSELAAYLIKETSETFRDKGNPYRQRYSCSRNLKKPEETVEVIKSESWRELPKVPDKLRDQGYVLDMNSIYTDIDVFGYPYQEYTMIRIDPPERGRKRT